MKHKITAAQSETNNIINELLNDGSDPNALYLIEHHLSSENFEHLEKVAIAAFQLGYEMTEHEECIDDNKKPLFIVDIISEIPLDPLLINKQIAQIIELTERLNIKYDGWGTYFEGTYDDKC